MTTFHAEATSIARGYKLAWTLDYDDAAQTVVIDVKQTDPDTGQPLPPAAGEAGGLTVTRANGQQRSFDFFALGYVNAGPQTIPGITLRINGTGRSQGFTLTTWFNPPPG